MEIALRQFCTYGIKSITMQEIARECGISKKTIYEHFSDKTELVDAVVAFLTNAHSRGLQQSYEHGRDAIEELVFSMRQTEMLVRSVNPVLMFELEKYHPAAWKVITDFKNDHVMMLLRQNLERGISEGLYRSDIKLGIIAQMRMMQLDAAFNPAMFPAAQFDLHEVMTEVTIHFIYGIATPQGHQLASRYLSLKQEA